MLFEPALTNAVDWETIKTVGAVLSPAIGALVGWLAGRKRNTADLRESGAKAGAIEEDTKEKTREQLNRWIERYSKAQEVAIEEEAKYADEKRELREMLDECLKEKRGCAEMKGRVYAFFDQLQSHNVLKLIDNAELMSEIQSLQNLLQPKKV